MSEHPDIAQVRLGYAAFAAGDIAALSDSSRRTPHSFNPATTVRQANTKDSRRFSDSLAHWREGPMAHSPLNCSTCTPMNGDEWSARTARRPSGTAEASKIGLRSSSPSLTASPSTSLAAGRNRCLGRLLALIEPQSI